mgnify:CR=1 FL=1
MAIVYSVSVGIGLRVDGFREVSGSFQGDSKVIVVRALSMVWSLRVGAGAWGLARERLRVVRSLKRAKG